MKRAESDAWGRCRKEKRQGEMRNVGGLYGPVSGGPEFHREALRANATVIRRIGYYLGRMLDQPSQPSR
jgi:hypothetical protein